MTSKKEWWVTEYAEDIHSYLLEKQKCRPTYRSISPQLSYRSLLVDWIRFICEKMEFTKTVQHLSMYMLDIFMDNHDIVIDHLHLVAVCCLIIAAKVEENDSTVPRFSELSVFMKRSYKLYEYVHMEISVLDFFQWDILVPTTAHFVEYYALYSLSASDYHDGKPLQSLKQARYYQKRYLEYFLEICLQEEDFITLEPSLVAAAIILTTRKCLLLTPLWPRSIQGVTHYKVEQLVHCSEILKRILDDDNKAAREEEEKEDSSESQETESDCSSNRMSEGSSFPCSPCNSS